MPYYFSWFYSLTIYRPVYFYTSNSVGIISPVEFANEAPHFQHKLRGKSWPHRAASNYQYLCGQIYASCLSHFSNCPSGIEQKLKWHVTEAFEKIYHFITYSWCLVPFSSNISWNHTYKVCLCFDYRTRTQYDKVLCSRVHSKKILLCNHS